jgi:Spy/CpxP family protein refolding chaperone
VEKSPVKKTCVWLLSVLAVMLLAAPAAMAQDGLGEDGPKVKKKRDRGKGKGGRRQKGGVTAKLVDELKLDDATRAKFNEQLKANRTALGEWMKTNGEKLKLLRKDMAEARKNRDKDKAKLLGTEMKALYGGRAKVEAEGNEKLMALLTDEQKSAWSGLGLSMKVLGRYRRCKLTEDQVVKVREMCVAAAKEIGDGKDRKAVGVAMRKLNGEIVKDVLTDEQRAKMKTRRKPKGDGARKPRVKKDRVKKDKPVKKDGGELGNPEW